MMASRPIGTVLQHARASWGKDVSTRIVGVAGHLELILHYRTVRTGFVPEFVVRDAVTQQWIDSVLLSGGSLREVCDRYGFDYAVAHRLATT